MESVFHIYRLPEVHAESHDVMHYEWTEEDTGILFKDYKRSFF